MLKEFNYQVARIFGTPLFKEKFNPIILNKDNIPKNGSVLLCGNHLHVLDQFPVICATKRVTHWMAKKEYFDSKIGVFFKMTGAICVDRKGNAKSSEYEAIDYLNKNSIVGLFPEGTRNGLKDEKIIDLYSFFQNDLSLDDFKYKINSKTLLSQINLLTELYNNHTISLDEYKKYIFNSKNALEMLAKAEVITYEQYDNSLLLPFKFGAVSMAQKTKSTIVPFAVTGDYKKENHNLVVNFGNPYKIESQDLELENDRLRKKVLTLLKDNNNYKC